MADEIHPAHPLVPPTPLDNHTDEKRRKKPRKPPEKSSDETEEIPLSGRLAAVLLTSMCDLKETS